MTSAETRRASSLPPPAASTRAAVAAANTTAVAASTAAAAANTRALKKADTAAVRPEATAPPPRKATRINTAGNFYLAFFFNKSKIEFWCFQSKEVISRQRQAGQGQKALFQLLWQQTQPRKQPQQQGQQAIQALAHHAFISAAHSVRCILLLF
jgi:hypothetical protein